ncbi:MAG: hypothetical protein GC155_05315 [Alphaproteobacteria bacterium]|nr:hypothetical protein [Alphaproteobacteria bacterium]
MGFGFGHASHLPTAHPRQDDRHPHEYGPIQGACVVLAGSALIVGLAFGAMLALTGPDGWITKATRTVMLGDTGAVMTAYVAEQAP